MKRELVSKHINQFGGGYQKALIARFKRHKKGNTGWVANVEYVMTTLI